MKQALVQGLRIILHAALEAILKKAVENKGGNGNGR